MNTGALQCVEPEFIILWMSPRHEKTKSRASEDINTPRTLQRFLLSRTFLLRHTRKSKLSNLPYRNFQAPGLIKPTKPINKPLGLHRFETVAGLSSLIFNR